MGVYIPLKVRLTPASIPQVVAYIQSYLKDNPIPSIDTFADLIAEFLSDHPELVAVASVNGKTGAVILTGADIMLNGDSALTLETEITNLNSMIANLSRQVAEAVATVENAQDDIDDLGSQIDDIEQTLTTISTSITQINNTIQTDEALISANTTKNAQQDTRLHALENSLDDVDEDIDNLQTLTELQTQQIRELSRVIDNPQEIDARLTAIENDVDGIESNLTLMQGNITQLQSGAIATNNRLNSAETRITTNENDIDSLDTRVTALEGGTPTPTPSSEWHYNFATYTVETIAPGSYEAVNLTFSSTISWGETVIVTHAQDANCVTNVAPVSNTLTRIIVRNLNTSTYTNNVIIRIYVFTKADVTVVAS